MIRNVLTAASTILVVTVFSGCSMFGGSASQKQLEAQNTARLEQLKTLAGKWEGTNRHGDETKTVTVAYKVTAGGSSVMETIAPGTEMEMVTLYTLDRGDLVLTHYCMLGNQPRMVARKGGDANEIHFDFAGCGNLKSPSDPHMHSAKLTFVDDNNIKAVWTLYRDGKPAEDAGVFDLKRAGG